MVKIFRDDHWNGFAAKLLTFVRDEHNKVQTSVIFLFNLTTTVDILSLSTTMNILSHFVNNFEHQVEGLLGKPEHTQRQRRIPVSREVLEIRDFKADS